MHLIIWRVQISIRAYKHPGTHVITEPHLREMYSLPGTYNTHIAEVIFCSTTRIMIRSFYSEIFNSVGNSCNLHLHEHFCNKEDGKLWKFMFENQFLTTYRKIYSKWYETNDVSSILHWTLSSERFLLDSDLFSLDSGVIFHNTLGKDFCSPKECTLYVWVKTDKNVFTSRDNEISPI